MKKTGSAEAITTFLGAEARVEGLLQFEGTIRVDGRVSGTVRSSSGTLIVGEKAVIEGDILVDVAVVRGQVTGMIQAASRIEVYPPARIEGDMQAPVISIDAGVVFTGNCSMPSTSTLYGRAESRISGDSGKMAQK